MRRYDKLIETIQTGQEQELLRLSLGICAPSAGCTEKEQVNT